MFNFETKIIAGLSLLGGSIGAPLKEGALDVAEVLHDNAQRGSRPNYAISGADGAERPSRPDNGNTVTIEPTIGTIEPNTRPTRPGSRPTEPEPRPTEPEPRPTTTDGRRDLYAGRFEPVSSYSGDLPAGNAEGYTGLSISTDESVLKVGVTGSDQGSQGLFVGERLLAQVHATPCDGISTRGAIQDAPKVDMECDDRGWCSGTSAAEWIPSGDSLTAGLSVVIYDTSSPSIGAQGVPMLCADLLSRVPKKCPRGSRPTCAGKGATLIIGATGGLECSDGGDVECKRRPRHPDAGNGDGPHIAAP